MAKEDWDRTFFPTTITHDDTAAENLFGTEGMKHNVTRSHSTDIVQCIRTTAASFDAGDQKNTVEFYIPNVVSNADFMIGCRVQDDGYDFDGYWARYAFLVSQKLLLYRRDAGVFTAIGTGGVVSLALDTIFRLEIKVIGTAITAEIRRVSDEVLQASDSATDATHSTGRAGLGVRQTGATSDVVFDNYEALAL